MTPGDDRFVPALKALRSVLLEKGYAWTYHLPSRFRLMAFAYEPVNLFNLALGRRNIMNLTAVPGLYSALACLAGRRSVVPLHALFQLGRPVPARRATSLLGEDLAAQCVACGILEDHGGQFLSTLRASPIGDNVLVFSNMYTRQLRDHPAKGVYAGRDSYLLMEWLKQCTAGRRFSRHLDLCSGTGIQTFTGAGVSDHSLGIDLRENCVAWAQRNAAVNEIENACFRTSNLFEHVDGSFDLITVNFPYDYGQIYGINVVVDVFRELRQRLNAGGELLATTLSWIDRDGHDALARGIEDAFADMPMDVTLIPVQYTLNYPSGDPEGTIAFIREAGIRKGIQYSIRGKMRSSGRLSLSVPRLAWPKALFWNTYCTAMRIRNSLASHRRSTSR